MNGSNGDYSQNFNDSSQDEMVFVWLSKVEPNYRVA